MAKMIPGTIIVTSVAIALCVYGAFRQARAQCGANCIVVNCSLQHEWCSGTVPERCWYFPNNKVFFGKCDAIDQGNPGNKRMENYEIYERCSTNCPGATLSAFGFQRGLRILQGSQQEVVECTSS